jgi:hypothetical protein
VLPTCRWARLPVAFDHTDWLLELKYTASARWHTSIAATSAWVSRKENTYQGFLGLGHSIAAALAERESVLDGETVYLHGAGRPQCHSLVRHRCPLHVFSTSTTWTATVRISFAWHLNRISTLKNRLYKPQAST